MSEAQQPKQLHYIKDQYGRIIGRTLDGIDGSLLIYFDNFNGQADFFHGETRNFQAYCAQFGWKYTLEAVEDSTFSYKPDEDPWDYLSCNLTPPLLHHVANSRRAGMTEYAGRSIWHVDLTGFNFQPGHTFKKLTTEFAHPKSSPFDELWLRPKGIIAIDDTELLGDMTFANPDDPNSDFTLNGFFQKRRQEERERVFRQLQTRRAKVSIDSLFKNAMTNAVQPVESNLDVRTMFDKIKIAMTEVIGKPILDHYGFSIVTHFDIPIVGAQAMVQQNNIGDRLRSALGRYTNANKRWFIAVLPYDAGTFDVKGLYQRYKDSRRCVVAGDHTEHMYAAPGFEAMILCGFSRCESATLEFNDPHGSKSCVQLYPVELFSFSQLLGLNNMSLAEKFVPLIEAVLKAEKVL